MKKTAVEIMHGMRAIGSKGGYDPLAVLLMNPKTKDHSPTAN